MAYKIVLAGDSGCGKSSLVDTLEESSPCKRNIKATVGDEFHPKDLTIDGKTTKVHLWDTSGQERFQSMCPQYFRDARGVIVVYDITRRKSFENVGKWVKEARDESTDPDIIIVGNKIDLENRAVSREEGLKLARENDFLFLETSAFQGDGIIPVLEKLVRKMLPRPVHPKPPNTIHLTRQAYDTAVNKERSWFERCCW
ncbi:ras-related protein Rab-18-like [Ischnura elegans]|uniref:ras-related protein Rab-18-like n=1 Tax=Ischnura elegans TaxID=197161 RepID=UPI001ED89838|nr:ras-related protein Rab-18-like [Ischnura elegans]